MEILATTGDRVARASTRTTTHRADFMGIPASNRKITWKDMIVTRFEDGRLAEEWPSVLDVYPCDAFRG